MRRRPQPLRARRGRFHRPGPAALPAPAHRPRAARRSRPAARRSCPARARSARRSEIRHRPAPRQIQGGGPSRPGARSEEHTSELQSQSNLVCRLLLEKKKKNKQKEEYCQSTEKLGGSFKVNELYDT